MIPRYGCTARCGTPEMYAMELGHPEFASENYASVTRAGQEVAVTRSMRSRPAWLVEPDHDLRTLGVLQYFHDR